MSSKYGQHSKNTEKSRFFVSFLTDLTDFPPYHRSRIRRYCSRKEQASPMRGAQHRNTWSVQTAPFFDGRCLFFVASARIAACHREAGAGPGAMGMLGGALLPLRRQPESRVFFFPPPRASVESAKLPSVASGFRRPSRNCGLGIFRRINRHRRAPAIKSCPRPRARDSERRVKPGVAVKLSLAVDIGGGVMHKFDLRQLFRPTDSGYEP